MPSMNDLSHPLDAAGAPGAPCPWLVADIGGTNARFGWIPAPGAAVERVRTLACAAHAGPAQAAEAYLATLRDDLGAAYRPPRAAAWAVATAVSDDEVALTNSGWRFSRRAAGLGLGLQRLLLLNDFEALALSLPHLRPAQLRAVGRTPEPPAGGTLAVVGPGTGLGVAAIVPHAGGWVAVPGEGGHATLAPGDEFESAVLAAARREHAHVSAERLLSGIGLPVLHRAVVAVEGLVADDLDAERIVERGLSGEDAACGRTLDLFCALLGSFAGNVALTVGARGGVFIGGGIVPRLGERFFVSRFRERFEAKGRFRGYLQSVPTWLITDTLVALAGAQAALEALESEPTATSARAG
jgi:glucokinase